MSSGPRSSDVLCVRIEIADGRRIQDFADEGYGPGADGFRADFLKRRGAVSIHRTSTETA
jgi:hypothetical protein